MHEQAVTLLPLDGLSRRQVCEQLLYLHMNSTLDEDNKSEFMRRLQKEVQKKITRSTPVAEPDLHVSTIVRPPQPRVLPTSPVPSHNGLGTDVTDPCRPFDRKEGEPLVEEANALLALSCDINNL